MPINLPLSKKAEEQQSQMYEEAKKTQYKLLSLQAYSHIKLTAVKYNIKWNLEKMIDGRQTS